MTFPVIGNEGQCSKKHAAQKFPCEIESRIHVVRKSERAHLIGAHILDSVAQYNQFMVLGIKNNIGTNAADGTLRIILTVTYFTIRMKS